MEILKSVFVMSAAGGMLALLLLCIKPVTRKYFSPKWQYYIWLTVLVVMVLPVKFSMPVKQIDIPSVSTAVQSGQNVTMQENTGNVQLRVLNELSEKPAVKMPEISVSIADILVLVWIAAALSVLVWKLAKYAMFLRSIKENSVVDCAVANMPKRLKVRKTYLLDAPLIVGLIKPVLYLPQEEIGQEELDYILLHELTHYKRHDILYKWFAMLVSSIHWFNPFVYIVSKQIDAECEVSCDYTVCKSLTEPQKNSYMTMILDFAGASVRNKRPLTTQMASSKKTLKRRFTMIKNKKATSKVMSVLSAVIAAVMLSATVFASGALSDLTADDYTIDILNDSGEKIELANKPFIENGALYLPLRETFEKVGVMDNENSYISWDNGKIEMNIVRDNMNIAYYCIEIGGNSIMFKRIKPAEIESDEGVTVSLISRNGKHKLKGSVTYVNIHDISYMLYGFFNIRNADNELLELGYNIYDKNGNDITEKFNLLTESAKEQELMKRPETTTSLFFNAFDDRNFEKMKLYCTQSCVDKFFGDDFVFGMKQAQLADMEIDDMEYAKSSNDFNIMVSVNMTPEENSVFDSSQTSTSFYVDLLRQPDGRYLINEFSI